MIAVLVVVAAGSATFLYQVGFVQDPVETPRDAQFNVTQTNQTVGGTEMDDEIEVKTVEFELTSDHEIPHERLMVGGALPGGIAVAQDPDTNRIDPHVNTDTGVYETGDSFEVNLVTVNDTVIERAEEAHVKNTNRTDAVIVFDDSEQNGTEIRAQRLQSGDEIELVWSPPDVGIGVTLSQYTVE